MLTSFIKNDLWDEARVFVGDKKFDGGVKAPEFKFEGAIEQKIGDSILFLIKN